MNLPQELALTFVVLVFMAGIAIIVWGIWEAATGFYDHVLGHYKRINNRRIDAAVGRVAFSFIRGVHYK